MQQILFITTVFILSLAQPSVAQTPDTLHQLRDSDITVYYSTGHRQIAANTAGRIKKAIAYHQHLLGIKPTVNLYVLNAKDWVSYTSDMIYGMPHYANNNRLYVAAEDNAFWKSFLPPLEKLPEQLRGAFQTAYGTSDGGLSMRAFFDLLAIHELGHAFHLQGGLNMQRMWMGELFSNILLHTYIAENEPELLPALTLFPDMVLAGGTSEFKFKSLKDVHERYNEIGQQHPKNYGWYQCRWHAAAAAIYEVAGKQLCRKLWDALKNKKETLSDEQLLSYLETAADKSIADVMRYWDRDTVK